MIKSLSGKGWIYDGEGKLGEVSYSLQEFTPEGFGSRKITGTIFSEKGINFPQMGLDNKMYTLQLNENEFQDFMITNVQKPNSAQILGSGLIYPERKC